MYMYQSSVSYFLAQYSCSSALDQALGRLLIWHLLALIYALCARTRQQDTHSLPTMGILCHIAAGCSSYFITSPPSRFFGTSRQRSTYSTWQLLSALPMIFFEGGSFIGVLCESRDVVLVTAFYSARRAPVPTGGLTPHAQ